MNNMRPVTILLVEDDTGDQKLIAQSLRAEKVSNQIKMVGSGEEAIEYMTASLAGEQGKPLPDLVLLDLNLPGMGGKEFLKRIKQNPGLVDIPVVILTTSDIDKDILDSYKLQASGYIKKPCSLAEFQTVMKSLNEYWFVICKRVTHDTGYVSQANQCSVG
ncbi:MAG TPA: response regulator [Sedimentisphaerales bacterium]|nr:response regulator [Sedimentisphaerales bacterium]